VGLIGLPLGLALEGPQRFTFNIVRLCTLPGDSLSRDVFGDENSASARFELADNVESFCGPFTQVVFTGALPMLAAVGRHCKLTDTCCSPFFLQHLHQWPNRTRTVPEFLSRASKLLGLVLADLCRTNVRQHNLVASI